MKFRHVRRLHDPKPCAKCARIIARHEPGYSSGDKYFCEICYWEMRAEAMMTGSDYERDLTACKEAYELHKKLKTFPKVAAAMGKSVSRVQQMAQTWRYHLEELEAAEELAAWRRA